MAVSLPVNSQPVVGPGGIATPAFYRFFGALAQSAQQSSGTDGLDAQIIAINKRIDKLSTGIVVRGVESIQGSGASVVTLSLANDLAAPGNTRFYGTSSTGAKGWHTVASALAHSADITLTTGTDGITTIGLSTVTDAGGGTLQKTAFDAKGRKTGTSAATTSDLTEGLNLYYTDARADGRVNAGIAAHVAAADPHPQYLTAAEAPASIFGAVDTSATAGTATALPAQPSGYVEVVIGGVTKKLPFYD